MCMFFNYLIYLLLLVLNVIQPLLITSPHNYISTIYTQWPIIYYNLRVPESNIKWLVYKQKNVIKIYEKSYYKSLTYISIMIVPRLSSSSNLIERKYKVCSFVQNIFVCIIVRGFPKEKKLKW